MMSNHKYDFNSDVVNIFIMIYDSSGSMDDYEYTIRKANEAFYNDFSRFEEKGSVAIAKAVFTEEFSMTPFGPVADFDTSYSAYGGTKLYSAISQAVNETVDYYTEIVNRLNIRPRITFLVFSDGRDSYCYNWEISDAKEKITQLNSLDATTVFVAFGEAIEAKDGEKLGFTCTRDISTAKELVSCLGSELSRSCMEQSKSAISLKSQFFSKAAPSDSSEQGTVVEQEILSDDFFDIGDN